MFLWIIKSFLSFSCVDAITVFPRANNVGTRCPVSLYACEITLRIGEGDSRP